MILYHLDITILFQFQKIFTFHMEIEIPVERMSNDVRAT